ncbi:MAG: hypothetical protein AAF502_24935 [Bacteroidota bacterium]
MSRFLENALGFGSALDIDDFDKAATFLHHNCAYDIGSGILIGPKAICGSYESNMKSGRAELDELIWGKCEAKTIDENKIELYFTDYLVHKGIKHTHQCKQILTFEEEGKIIAIKHINLPGEPEKLLAFYSSVGLRD